jgi:hypothetical protein
MRATAILVLWDGRLPLFCHHRGSTKEESMSLDLLAIDLGKQSFHIHGIDSDGVSRKISRAKVIRAIAELAPAMIAMEACASAHYWKKIRHDLFGGRVVAGDRKGSPIGRSLRALARL